MTNLVIHPVTLKQVNDLLKAPSHAVMLVGPTGSGKQSLAYSLAEQVLQIPSGSLENFPYKLIIAPEENKSIGIEAVRELESFMSLKVPGTKTNNRIVILNDAHLLTLEAQNALLKTLEEPPTGALIILNVNHEQALLPTIRSRTQSIAVKRPEKQIIYKHFQSLNHDDKTISQAYAISGGLPGLMTALLSDSDHPLLAATEHARQLLNQTVYQRLLAVDELAKNRKLALDTTFIMQQMAHVSLQSASGTSATKWQAILTASYEAAEALSGNAQPKLALTKLMLSL